MNVISIIDEFRNCARSDAGATALEYGLIAGAMGLGTALGMTVLGPGVIAMYRLIADSF